MSGFPSLGMDFAFGFYELPPIERMKAIKAAGFDDIMLWWGDEFKETDGTPMQLFDLAMKEGLRVRTAHFPTDDTPSLWTIGADGDRYEKCLIKALHECGERGIEHLVVHTTKKLITPPPSQIGVYHMRRAAEEAERNKVDIALENTRFLQYNQYLYERVPSPRMKFCFDSGHAHCFTPGQDPLSRFGDRLVTMHLHDNHGQLSGDEHRLPGDGTIDFSLLAQRLAVLHPSHYNIESRYGAADAKMGLSMENYLTRAYQSLRAIAMNKTTKIA